MGVLISTFPKPKCRQFTSRSFGHYSGGYPFGNDVLAREYACLYHWYSGALPATQYLEITRGIIVRGVDAITLLYTFYSYDCTQRWLFYRFASLRKHL